MAQPEILECDRRAPEGIRRLGCATEVVTGAGDGSPAERTPQGSDMRSLMRADDAGLGQLAPKRTDSLGLRVERVLQILE